MYKYIYWLYCLCWRLHRYTLIYT